MPGTGISLKLDEPQNEKRFFATAEDRAEALDANERIAAEKRLQVARDLLRTRGPLDFLRAWQSLRERYESQHDEALLHPSCLVFNG